MSTLALSIAAMLVGSDAAAQAAPSGAERASGEETLALNAPLTASQRTRVLDALQAVRREDYAGARRALDELRAELPEGHWAEALAAELGALVSDRAPQSSAQAESVASLYVTTTLYGLYTGAWLFGALLELDGRAGFPLAVGTAGLGFGVGYLLDRELEIGGAEADAISSGLTLGAVQGALLLPALGVDDDAGEDALLTTSWLVGVGSGALAGWAAHATGASRGDVGLVSSSYLWGGVLGLGIALTLDEADEAAGAWVLGSSAGVVGGLLAAPEVEWSTSRILWINLGGLLGALAGGAGLVAGGADDGRLIAGVLSASYGGGLAIAGWLTEDGAPKAEEVAGIKKTGAMSLQVAPRLLAPPDPSLAPAPGLGLSLRW